MKTELKPGLWEDRNKDVWEVYHDRETMLWTAVGSIRSWQGNGRYWAHDEECQWDLVRYLGPVELSPTPACAEAGPAGDPQTVSTEDPQESLRRMRVHWNALCREEAAYGEALLGVQKAKGNLEEAIKVMEREVEG